jgi:hypothetical protein
MFHNACGFARIQVDGRTGATVNQGELTCELPPDQGGSGMWPAHRSALPPGCVVVIRVTELVALAERISALRPVADTPNDLDKTLGERERITLLLLVAALARKLKIDVSKTTTAAKEIEALTIEIDARVSPRAIADHLKRIPDALERRGRLSL